MTCLHVAALTIVPVKCDLPVRYSTYLVLFLRQNKVGHLSKRHSELDDLAFAGVGGDAAEVQHSTWSTVDDRINFHLKHQAAFTYRHF